MSKEQEIRLLLSQGSSKAELIRRGYSRGSVYKVGCQLRQQGNLGQPASDTGNAGASPATAPLSLNPSVDPEISHLRKEIQRAKLEAELNRVRGEAKTVEELERKVARLRAWTVEMVSSLGQAIEQLAGNAVDPAAFQAFEEQAVLELQGHKS